MHKTGLLETLSALRKAGLLTGIKTHFRNFFGNMGFQLLEEVSRLPRAAVDIALALGTGERTVQGVSPLAMAKATYAAATEGVREAKNIMRHGVSGNALLKVSVNRPVNSGIRWLDAYANFIFRLMSAEDAIFKSYAFRRSLEEQAFLTAKRTGQVPAAILAAPTPAMFARAFADAEFATFNNKNILATEWSQGKSRLSQKGVAGATAAFAGDLVVPFTNTPANILARVLDYSVVGAVAKGGTAAARSVIAQGVPEAQQRAMADALGRGMTGSAIIWLGWTLAAAGLLTGGGDDDEGDRNVATAAGRLPGALLLGDRWHTVNALSPLGNLLTLGATMYRQSSRPLRNELSRAGKIAGVATQTVLDQPMLTGLQNIVDTLENPGRRLESFIGSNAGSFVPTFIADAASMFDPYRRDARPDGFTEALWRGPQGRLPGLRNWLPEKTDMLGRTVKQDKLSAVYFGLGSPAKELTDPVLKALLAADVGLGSPKRRDNETDAELRTRTRAIGQAIEKRLVRVVRSSTFNARPLEWRREQLERAVADGREDARKRQPPPSRPSPRSGAVPREGVPQ